MRAVTQPYSPPACDEQSPSGRNTERRPLGTCAIDRRSLDAVMADVAQLTAEAEYEEISPAAQTSVSVPPAWMQLFRLEELLREWMTANEQCDRAALAELFHREPAPRVRTQTMTSTATATNTPSGGSDYLAKLAARLVRRSA